MAVYSTRFLDQNDATVGELYPVPAGKVAVVHFIALAWPSSSAGIIFMASIQAVCDFWTYVIPDANPGSAQFNGKVVLNAGDILDIAATGPCSYACSGWLLDDS